VNANVEFDKDKFAAYHDTVVLSKLVLVQELDPLGGVTPGTGQLSKLMSDALTAFNGSTFAPYDWTLLNMVGNHGGNVMTTTLPKPTVFLTFDSAADVVPVGATFTGGDVDSSAHTISLPGHSFLDGDLVWYDSCGSAPFVDAFGYKTLFDGHPYFVEVDAVDPSKILLHATRPDALSRVDPRPLSGGSVPSTYTLRVDATDFSSPTGLSTGDAVRYDPAGGTEIAGDNLLNPETLYYVNVERGGTRVHLYQRVYDALTSAMPIELVAAATGNTQTLYTRLENDVTPLTANGFMYADPTQQGWLSDQRPWLRLIDGNNA